MISFKISQSGERDWIYGQHTGKKENQDHLKED